MPSRRLDSHASPLLPCALTRSAPTAVLMMNHSNLLDLKQNEAVTFRGVVPLGFRRKSGVFSVCCLALVAVLLASESLPCVPGHSLPCLPFLLHPLLFYMDIARASLCACMCAPVYTCIERYICRVRGGTERSSGLTARTLRTRTCHLPFCVGEIRGCG